MKYTTLSFWLWSEQSPTEILEIKLNSTISSSNPQSRYMFMNYGDYGRLSILTNFKIKYGKDIFLLRIVCESDVKSVLLVSYTAVQS